MKFICNVCKQKVSYIAKDEHLFRSMEWECLRCYSVIAKKRYPDFISDYTFFSDCGSKLGDSIKAIPIFEFYKQNNLKERIIRFNEENVIPPNLINNSYPGINKYFLFDVSRLPKDKRVGKFIWISLTAESRALGFNNIFPKWEDYQKPTVKLPNKYFVFHIRNVNDQNHQKNMSTEEFNIISHSLSSFSFPVILVGNDAMIEGEIHSKNMIDLRNKFSIPQLAYVLKSKRNIGYVGKDSGPMHIAAMHEQPIYSWGFVTPDWFPQTKNKNAIFILGNPENNQLQVGFRAWLNTNFSDYNELLNQRG